MDTLNKYRNIVQHTLQAITKIPYAYGELQHETIFDQKEDRYLLLAIGWHGAKRVHSCMVHLDIIDGQVWVQTDGTEGIVPDLLEAGIPKKHIVLAFHPRHVRPYTGFAVA